MMKKGLFLTIVASLIAYLNVGYCQTPLKIIAFTAQQMEVEDDLFKMVLIATINQTDVVKREFSVVSGNGVISTMGKYKVIEFQDSGKVKVQVIASDAEAGCDTAYLTCSPPQPRAEISKTFYLDEGEWAKATRKSVEALKKSAPYRFTENDPKLPNLLIIGTSISIGYTPFVRENLAGVVNTYRIPENSNSTESSKANIDFWLGDMKWDVIHVNWGLHDLKYTISGEEQDVSPAKYQANLRKLFTRLTQTGAKIIWANTSYYPEKCSPRRDVGDDALYNELALEVLKDFPDIVVDDQYTLTKANPQNQLANNVHFKAEGYKQQAAQASEAIRAVLLK